MIGFVFAVVVVVESRRDDEDDDDFIFESVVFVGFMLDVVLLFAVAAALATTWFRFCLNFFERRPNLMPSLDMPSSRHFCMRQY